MKIGWIQLEVIGNEWSLWHIYPPKRRLISYSSDTVSAPLFYRHKKTGKVVMIQEMTEELYKQVEDFTDSTESYLTDEASDYGIQVTNVLIRLKG